MKAVVMHIRIILLMVVLAVLSSCAFGPRLNTVGATAAEVTGTYTLIFYGCNHGEDLETVAIFDREGDNIVFEPYAPQFNYRTIKGVPASEALEEAEKFVNCHTSYHRSQLRKIIDNDARILGYELRPLYLPFAFGIDDVLITSYSLGNNKVYVTVRLDPSVEKMLSGGGHAKDRD